MKVGVVTAFVPLPVKHLNEDQYHELGGRLIKACKGRAYPFYEGVGECWLYDHNPPMIPANPVPEDRYDGPLQNVLSNIVQHNRTEWAMRAAEMHPSVDVWVWLDYGILKQGFWRNNPVTEETVERFLDKVSRVERWECIPFPGITPHKEEVKPTGNIWRFAGSTHIWPATMLLLIDRAYKEQLLKWIKTYKTTPLDLPIWALVEQNTSLPFKWYGAEYDASQLDNFPGGQL